MPHSQTRRRLASRCLIARAYIAQVARIEEQRAQQNELLDRQLEQLQDDQAGLLEKLEKQMTEEHAEQRRSLSAARSVVGDACANNCEATACMSAEV